MALSVAIALVTVWAAIAASYLYNWPVGFFVGALAALSYGTRPRLGRMAPHPHPPSHGTPALASHDPQLIVQCDRPVRLTRHQPHLEPLRAGQAACFRPIAVQPSCQQSELTTGPEGTATSPWPAITAPDPREASRRVTGIGHDV